MGMILRLMIMKIIKNKRIMSFIVLMLMINMMIMELLNVSVPFDDGDPICWLCDAWISRVKNHTASHIEHCTNVVYFIY